ncbi:o-succinylbenzoate--CoA ligase [Effusibacillus dendaii]|nr:o-succinylbenzoate--CoA ligase [Effusibacillus dendaii]
MSGDWLPDWLSRRASGMPNQIAVKGKTESLTFADLYRQAEEIAKRLASLGIQAGDKVAWLMRNSVQTAVWIHALSRLGVVQVPLNIRLTASEIVWQLTDVEAKLLVFDDIHTEKAAEIGELLPSLTQLNRNSIGELPFGNAVLRDRIRLSDTYCIIYTSGTTGRPKGAMLTYGNHWWNAIGSSLNLGLEKTDRWLACVPFFHVSGLSILMRSVIYGMPVIVHESFDPATVNRSIEEDGVTIISVVSHMLFRMLEEQGDRPYPDTLRCVLLGGGPAPLPLLEDCERRNIPVVQTYGMTETGSQIVTLSPEDAIRKLGSAGKPLLPAELRIELDGQILPAGEVGEIAVRGPSVTIGYYNRPETTKEALRDGWLHTGDLGYLDEEGYLYVLDRRKDLIISGGENVYPAEVESVLLAHDAIKEAGVTGIPDEKWGQVPVAAVKLTENQTVTEAELIEFCRKQLASYKVPKRIQFVDQLPRNASDKLLRRLLADLFREEAGAR